MGAVESTMSDDSAKGGGQIPAKTVWIETLSRVPSLFGRLALLASLRSNNSGKYEHYGLAMRYSTDEADAVLRESHEESFEEWLSYSLPEQKSDLDMYLSGLDVPKREAVEAWLALQPFRNLLPARVRQPELQLYLADLAALLELLKAESGAASPDPDA